jgi:hypothetical protein
VKKQKLREYNIVVGEIGICFIFDQSLFDNKIKYYKNEFVAQNRTDIKLNLHHSNIPANTVGKKIFDSETNWSLYYHDGKYILQDRSFESNLPPDKFIILLPDFKSGNIYFSKEGFHQNSPFDPLQHYLIEILMIILLSLDKGILMHACGVIDDKGDGHLFLGNSTNGKSTIAKLWSENGATVLNDDRIIVREKDGEFWMYGTPWHGDFNEVSSKALPIRKVFFLKHGKENSTVPKKGAEAVSMLLTRAFPPLWDQKGMDYTLGLLDRMASSLPCHELHFLPNKKIIDFVRNI